LKPVKTALKVNFELFALNCTKKFSKIFLLKNSFICFETCQKQHKVIFQLLALFRTKKFSKMFLLKNHLIFFETGQQQLLK
jgi:hypothetical protein